MDIETHPHDLFTALLPPPRETLFLAACLASGRAAREAWQRFCRPPAGAGSHIVFGPMAPLFYFFALKNALPVHKTGLTYLRTAYLNEQLRTRRYAAILSELLAVLERHDIPVILSGAGALARTVYAEPALRHCHEVELLVRGDHLKRVVPVLLANGFALPDRRESRAAHSTLLIHTSGLPLELRRGLFVGRRMLTLRTLWGRCQHDEELNVRLLPPVESLLRVGIHDFLGPQRRSGQWAADAFLLIASSDGIDWDRVAASVDRSPHALPLYLGLRYLRRKLGADVPPVTLRRLCAETRLPLPRRSAKKALFEALSHDDIDWNLLTRMKSGWRRRFEILSSMLFPPSPYLRRANPCHPPPKLFSLYLRRLGRCLATELRTQRRRRYEGRAVKKYIFSPETCGEQETDSEAR